MGGTPDECFAQKNLSNTNASIILIDIDNFKTINDQKGHLFGDMVIQRVSKIITQNTRKTDLFFRIGGDEFLLLSRNTSAKEASQLANKICQLIHEEALEDVKISVSIGVSGITQEVSHSLWMEHADKALYKAKESGRNCVKMFTEA